MTRENTNRQETEIAALLESTAQKIQPSLSFQARLENDLKAAYRPRQTHRLGGFRNFLPALGFSGALIVLAFLLNWAIQNFTPNSSQSGAGNTPSACPVTEPNGSLPPGETVESPEYLGNDLLWTVLRPQGRVLVTAANREPDGAYSMKWGWWRGQNGALTIEGRRLDADSAPLRADIPEGYGDSGFQVSALIFPEPGCWEVTGRVADAALTFVTEVIVVEEAPTPEAIATQSDTVRPVGKAYERNGMQVYLSAPLPSIPAEAAVYNYQPEKLASLDDARALAAQFGMSGQVYETNGEIPTTKDFLIVDGNQRLHVRSDQYFQYFPDYPRYIAAINGGTPPENADELIDEFMKSHGFGFAYELQKSEMYGGYIAAPLTPDGHIICYEYFKCAGLRFTLDEQGILYMDGDLPRYENLGEYRIISAEEAFQRYIDPESMANQGMGGLMEGMNSFAPPFQTWLRPRPLDETITLFGWINSIPSLEGGAPLVSLDGFTATGNLADIPTAFDNTFVEATGQFHETNGLRTFELESWKTYEGYEDGLLGAISRQGDQVILNTVDDEILILPDASDLPLPLDNVFVIGIRVDDTFEWKSIDQRNAFGGGGGGGGGSGFYKLNLTGAPVPFPTPIPRVEGGGGGGSIEAYLVQPGDTINSIAAANGITPEELMQLNGMTDASQLQVGQTLTVRAESMSLPQNVEALRGYLAITIYKQTDGNQRVEYGFINDSAPFPYLTLEGENLEPLQAYQGRPVDVWGTIEMREGQIVLKVERYEIPFPDLQFQILRGRQTSATLNGETVTLFTTDDGKTYVQFNPGGGVDGSTVGAPDDEVLIETLIVPDETFGSYPALRIFSAASAVNPKSGEAQELQISADQIYVVDEALEGPHTQPTLIIERVELVYYMPEPRYLTGELSIDQHYLQPAWLFTGHYSDGSAFFVLVQALGQEFLLPEQVPFQGPG